MPKRYWLMKSEPHVYSYEDLEKDGETYWEGVRNYQARNFMQEMAGGDAVLFYHSNAKPPHVAGIAEVSREAYPDYFAFEPESKYYDPKSSSEKPRWFMVDLKPIKRLSPVSLQALKDNPALEEMRVVQKGQRLSVMPVTEGEFAEVRRMGSSG